MEVSRVIHLLLQKLITELPTSKQTRYRPIELKEIRTQIGTEYPSDRRIYNLARILQAILQGNAYFLQASCKILARFESNLQDSCKIINQSCKNLARF